MSNLPASPSPSETKSVLSVKSNSSPPSKSTITNLLDNYGLKISIALTVIALVGIYFNWKTTSDLDKRITKLEQDSSKSSS